MKPIACDECGRDHTGRAWHGKQGKWYCDTCYVPEHPSLALTFEQRLERSLPKGKFLGPKNSSGVRGVFQQNKR